MSKSISRTPSFLPGVRIPLGMSLLAVLLAGGTHPALAVMDRHLEAHQRVIKGPKMVMSAATFFGAEGVEEFIGLTETPDGQVVAIGNSWGPPFPGTVKPVVLGPGQLWDVPLYLPGKERGKGGNMLAPPPENPNRTGFLVFYSEDLRQIRKVVRFGWGLASISASTVTRDGGVVIAGNATRNFRALAKIAKSVNLAPAKTGEGFGPVRFGNVMTPGDVYVARLTPDLQGFEWVWIFEGHRNAPDKVFEGKDSDIYFNCHSIRCISDQGRKMRDYADVGGYADSGRKMLMGVHPKTGNLLIGGDYHNGTGREPWRKPVMRVMTPDWRKQAVYYDWAGPLVGHDDFRLVSDSAVRTATFLPSGEIVLTGWSDGGNSVLTRNPVDLAREVKGMGLGLSGWGVKGALSFAHFARFNPDNYEDSAYNLYCSYLQTVPNSMAVEQVKGTRDGNVVILASSASFLVQTTNLWFHANNQYQREVLPDMSRGDVLKQANGWPMFQGIGGGGSHMAVLTRNLDTMLWCSTIPMCQHRDAIGTKLGVVAVSTCRGDGAGDGRDPSILEDDIAYLPEFITTLTQGARDTGLPASRLVWKLLTEELKKALLGFQPDKAVDPKLVAALKDDLNDIIFDARDLFSPDLWKTNSFNRAEMEYLTKLKDGRITDNELGDFNRRLLEKAFPRYLFPHPVENRAAILNPVQGQFGGGYSDGHIYLLTGPFPQGKK